MRRRTPGQVYERIWYAARPDRIRTLVGRAPHAAPGGGHVGGALDEPSDEEFVRQAFRILLQREPDPGGEATYLKHLREGSRTRHSMLAEMRGLDEFWTTFAFDFVDPIITMHRSRCLFAQTFPKATNILDLGGVHQSSRGGALVLLGYPYPFEVLRIVDLPSEDRHELYSVMGEIDRAETRLGPVEYHYQSMTDLSNFADGTFDLVYSGQTIEHVTEVEGDDVLSEAFRVLSPGGFLCLDTPNYSATKLMLAGTGIPFSNPDHKLEYTHEQLSAKIESHGFDIREAKGLVHLPETFRTGTLVPNELAANTGVFDDIAECSLLAYVCRKREL